MKSIFKFIADKKFYLAIGAITILIILVIISSATNKTINPLSLVGVGTDKKSDGYIRYEPTRTESEAMAISGEWLWTETTYDKKGWAPAKPNKVGDFALTLNTLMEATVKTDCNNLSGKYSLAELDINSTSTEIDNFKSSGNIQFSNMSSTKKYCEGSKEVAFTNDFTKVSAYNLQAKTLTLIVPGVGKISFVRSEVTEGQ